MFGGSLSFTGFLEPWQGWYLEPGFLYLRSNKDSGSWIGGQMIGGYEQSWESGFFINIGLGAGVGRFDDGNDNEGEFLDLDGVFPYPTWNALTGYRF